VLLEHGGGLLNSKMASQGPTMKLLNDQFPKAALRDAQPCALKEEPVLDVEETMGMLGAFRIKLLEIFIMDIQALHHLKTKNFGAQSRK